MENQNIPDFLRTMLLKQYGENTTNKIIDGYLAKKDVTLRVNTIKSNIEEITQVLSNNKIKYEQVSWNNDAFIIKDIAENKIKELEIYEQGKIYLQSLSSMIPPIVLEPKEKENILDMAAAPGGKTTQMAALTNNKCMITACEKNKIRAERLKYNLQKQGVGCTNVMLEDARNLSDFFSFDKILLDAPCSGSGTDNVNTKFFTKELIQKSSKIQERLLEKALKLLKPGNDMVYSTCSILEQENEEVLKKVLPKYNAKIIPIEISTDIPTLPVGLDGTICVCPSKNYEGFYVAKIRKNKI